LCVQIISTAHKGDRRRYGKGREVMGKCPQKPRRPGIADGLLTPSPSQRGRPTWIGTPCCWSPAAISRWQARPITGLSARRGALPGLHADRRPPRAHEVYQAAAAVRAAEAEPGERHINGGNKLPAAIVRG